MIRARLRLVLLTCLLAAVGNVRIAQAQTSPQVVDIPTRPEVTQRILYLAPEHPRAAAILFTGGDGSLGISSDGGFARGGGNFLVRSRQRFVDQGIAVAIVDAPSDHQSYPYLTGFRQTPAHGEDIQGVIAWLRGKVGVPVWLIGTSRGTQSAAYLAVQLGAPPGGADGLVLTSTILQGKGSRSVPDIPNLERLSMPVLVAHHREDGCRQCDPAELPKLMDKLQGTPRHQLLLFQGGANIGDPCEARAHHGFNGIEDDVVAKVSAWMLAP